MSLRSALTRIGQTLFASGPPRAYQQRPCQGRAWHQAFPHARKPDVRAFLALFAGSFAYRDREKLKFRPDDALMQIYRAHYPNRWTPDAMEMETFDMRLEKRYGVTLSGIWHEDLTLGEVFRSIQGNDA